MRAACPGLPFSLAPEQISPSDFARSDQRSSRFRHSRGMRYSACLENARSSSYSTALSLPDIEQASKLS